MKRRALAAYERELGFVPMRSVRWLDPPELARTAAKAALAKVFADYGDKREVQAVLPGGAAPLPRSGRGMWIDFTADTGDGFAPTYTVASALAAPELTVTRPNGEPMVLPRGDLLVLGGDEVYPAASARAYENRTIGPYRAAFPREPGAPQPALLAVPGNHDWYDGLTSFLRIFAHGAPVGGWRTVQTRSYFAARLAPGWWIAGLDSQLSEYIDEPQLDYFRKELSAHLAPGDGVIVCTASPGWVHTVTEGPDGFNQLHFFERTIIRSRPVPGARDGETEPTGAEVRLWLTGDLHHYSRYAQQVGDADRHDPRSVQAITCGLGGAYTAQTHDLPDDLELPPAQSRIWGKEVPGMPMRRRGPTYPDQETSRRLFRHGANPLRRTWLGWRNFAFLVGMGWLQLVLVTALAWVVDLVSPGQGIVAIFHTPPERAAIVLGIVLGAAVLVMLTHGVAARIWGVPGFVASLGAVFLLAAGCLTLLILIAAAPALPAVPLLALAVFVGWWLGAVLGTFAFGIFLLTQRTGTVASWRMSAQSLDTCTGFLRMTIDERGDLIVHPLAIDEPCREWDLGTGPDGLRPTLVGGLPGIRLLEEPIVISQRGFPRS